MLVLLVSELILFALLQLSWSRSPRVNHMVRQLMTVKDLAELRLGSGYISAEHEQQALTPLLQTLGRSLQAAIWVTGPYGEIVASSDARIPDMSSWTSGESVKSVEGAYLYKKKGGDLKSVYGVYTAKLPEGYPFTYHLFHSLPRFNEESWLMRAQLVLTFIAAVFLIPVARHIIRPLKELTVSASKMGHGDLKQRVRIKGHDEIAELGRAFNNMAAGLGKTIKSSRELTANVSHELRSPLARMRISLEMLKERIEEGKPDDCETFVKGMQSEITHMDELIGKIIEFAKLDMQKLPAMNETADMKAIIEDLLSQYEHIAIRNNLRIETTLEKIKITDCNRNGLSVIMDNILGNAFKYTEQEGTISIRLFSCGRNVHIESVNTHAPLPEEDLEEIFSPFHRLKGQEIPGSGLGLAAAQKLAAIHGGYIRAENCTEGFKIIVELPAELRHIQN